MNEALRKAGAVLYHLGSTPEKIAETLTAEGIKGDHSPKGCPLACKLRKDTGEQVCVGLVTFQADGKWVNLPSVCQEFVSRFDNGEWPELYKESE